MDLPAQALPSHQAGPGTIQMDFKGYRGGSSETNSLDYQGESYGGVGAASDANANLGGGGAGISSDANGGGAGYINAGTASTDSGGGLGGMLYGYSTLDKLLPGSGGGGGNIHASGTLDQYAGSLGKPVM